VIRIAIAVAHMAFFTILLVIGLNQYLSGNTWTGTAFVMICMISSWSFYILRNYK